MLLKLWKWLTRFIPRIIPMDPPADGGSTMLLFTVRPLGFLGDQNDNTSIMQERTDPNPGPHLFWTAGEMIPDNAFPANFSHVIMFVRARVADHFFGQDALYSDDRIVYKVGQEGGLPENYVAVQPWPELSFDVRSTGPIALAPDGQPWTYEKIVNLVVGGSVLHTTNQFGIEGYFDLADVWVEAYGVQDEPIRQRKFSGGIYTLEIGGETHTAVLDVSNVRAIYEAALSARDGKGNFITARFTANVLDTGEIGGVAPPVNSDAGQMLDAIDRAQG